MPCLKCRGGECTCALQTDSSATGEWIQFTLGSVLRRSASPQVKWYTFAPSGISEEEMEKVLSIGGAHPAGTDDRECDIFAFDA